MTITVQARAAGGEWMTRNAFIDDNKLVVAGSMQKSALIAKAQKVCEQWRAFDDGKELRVHDDSVASVESDPRTDRKQKAEKAARVAGWRTNLEQHGVDDYGVVHPTGRWAPDWEAACGVEPRTAAGSLD